MRPRRHILPVFVPHLGCKNTCVFCNQRQITGTLVPATAETVRRIIDGASFLREDGIQKQLAFYGGSFTAIPVSEQVALLEAAQTFRQRFTGASLRLSTAPDCISEETLLRLRAYGVVTIELGVQSMDDGVLQAAGRSYSVAQVVRAAQLIRAAGFELILQMMTGLPLDTPQKAVITAEHLISLKPDGVRIYPTVVIKGTALYDAWRSGDYQEHTVEEAIALCARLVALFEAAHIPVIRLGLNPTEELSHGEAVGGAYHPAFGELVYGRILANKALAQLTEQWPFESVALGVAPSKLSGLTGHNRLNLQALQTRFKGARLTVVGDQAVLPGEIMILSIEKGLK